MKRTPHPSGYKARDYRVTELGRQILAANPVTAIATPNVAPAHRTARCYQITARCYQITALGRSLLEARK